jgi:indole-3-acetate monooxygenase
LLDELSAAMRRRAGRAGAHVGSDSLHEQYGNAEATLRSAKALVRETWADVWDTLVRGDDLSTRQKTLIRLSLNRATWSAYEVGSFVYVAGGTDALRAGPIQRFYRDLHGGTQHIMSAPPVLRHAGRELAGLAAGQRWFHVGMVEDK